MRRNIAVYSDPSLAVMVGEFPSHEMGDVVHGMSDDDLIDHARDWLIVAGHFKPDEAARLHLAVREGG